MRYKFGTAIASKEDTKFFDVITTDTRITNMAKFKTATAAIAIAAGVMALANGSAPALASTEYYNWSFTTDKALDGAQMTGNVLLGIDTNVDTSAPKMTGYGYAYDVLSASGSITINTGSTTFTENVSGLADSNTDNTDSSLGLATPGNGLVTPYFVFDSVVHETSQIGTQSNNFVWDRSGIAITIDNPIAGGLADTLQVAYNPTTAKINGVTTIVPRFGASGQQSTGLDQVAVDSQGNVIYDQSGNPVLENVYNSVALPYLAGFNTMFIPVASETLYHVPAPLPIALLGFGLTGLGYFGRKARANKA